MKKKRKVREERKKEGKRGRRRRDTISLVPVERFHVGRKSKVDPFLTIEQPAFIYPLYIVYN